MCSLTTVNSVQFKFKSLNLLARFTNTSQMQLCLQPHILYVLEDDTSVPVRRTPSVYDPCLSSLAR